MTEMLKQELELHWNEIVLIRKDLHRNAELGYQEFKTAKILKNSLEKHGISFSEPYATGILASLKCGEESGRVIALRADMDALPIEEGTGVDFRSLTPGVMHACGHDAHMTIVLGTAIVLKHLEKYLRGTIKFIFQPAEELSGGAKGMVDSGVLDNPKVDRVLGLHVSPDLLGKGQFGVCRKETNASSNSVRIKIYGKGGHISTPHLSINPIYAGMELIGRMQVLRTQMFSPFDDVILDVAAVHAGGTLSNISPEEFSLVASVRAYDIAKIRAVDASLRKILDGIALSYGVTYDMDFNYGFEPVVNDEIAATEYRASAANVIGSENVVITQPEMGAEDFYEYLNKVPGAYAFIGIDQKTPCALHSSMFIVDEETIERGILVMCQAVMDYLNH